jgi:cell division septum initiation protein DivIVA
MTTADVTGVNFDEDRRGRVDPGEVDSHLRRVAAELARVTRERDELDAEVAHLRSRPYAAPDQSEVSAVSVLVRAQQNADQLIAAAQHQARDMSADGRRQRDELMADGRAKAGQIIQSALEEAGREAARVVAQAPVTAQLQLTYYQALAATVRTQLEAFTASLAAAVRQWETDQQASSQVLIDEHTGQAPPAHPIPG